MYHFPDDNVVRIVEMYKEFKNEIRTSVFHKWCDEGEYSYNDESIHLCVNTKESRASWTTEIFILDSDLMSHESSSLGELHYLFSINSNSSFQALENHIALVYATLHLQERPHMYYFSDKMQYKNHFPKTLMKKYADKKKSPNNFDSKYCRALLENSGIKMLPKREFDQKILDAFTGVQIKTYNYDQMETFRYEYDPEHFRNKNKETYDYDDLIRREELQKKLETEGILKVRKDYLIRPMDNLLEIEELNEGKKKKKKKSIKKVNGKKIEKKLISKEALKNEAKRKENLKKLKAKNNRKR